MQFLNIYSNIVCTELLSRQQQQASNLLYIYYDIIWTIPNCRGWCTYTTNGKHVFLKHYVFYKLVILCIFYVDKMFVFKSFRDHYVGVVRTLHNVDSLSRLYSRVVCSIVAQYYIHFINIFIISNITRISLSFFFYSCCI